MDLASATDLEQWAQRRDAQDALPQLVRRLIVATADGLTRLSVRAGEGVGLPGWDGVAEAAGATPFVPAGLSVWEMGVGEPGAKAQSDYKKRTEDSGGVDPATTTFVFVTPRRWDGKDAWVARKQKKAAAPPAAGKTKHVWNAIRVVDADDLEAWLETAPAVHAWLSALLGKDPYEAESLEGWWTTWSEATSPALPPAVPLSGRDAEVDRLRAFLAEPAASTSIVADSQDDALAFLAATLIGDVPRLAQALVVRTPAAWRRLSTWPTPLLLVPTFERPLVSIAVQAGHHVVLPLGREVPSAMGIALPRVRRAGIQHALMEAGLPRDRASSLATLGRRSLFALRRRLAVNPDADQPEWALPEHARTIALAVLTGSWNDASPGDRDAVVAIAGRPYDEVVHDLSRWANASNPPVRRVGEVWMVAAKPDTWALTARALTTDDLDRFRATAVAVIGGDDPALDLPPKQRMAAGLFGKQRPHSGALVRGLADTVAMMAASDPHVTLVGGRRGETEAVMVVRDVLDAANRDASGRRWHAVASVLPLLAEAAPDVFLRAVEAGSQDAAGPVLTLFQDEDSFTASSPHPSLLWALEALAWSPTFIPRAVQRLASLARLAPPVQIANKPFNSLQDILVLWSHGTAASLAERVQMLDVIHRVEPDVAWSLAVALIPTGSGSTSPPASPTYRDWKPDDADQGVLVADLDRALDGVVQRACVWAGTEGARWAELVERVASAVIPAREHVISALEGLDPSALSADGRQALYRALRGLVNRHRRYPDAHWAMPEDSTQRLKALISTVEPTQAADRHEWLFSYDAVDAFSSGDSDDEYEQGYQRLGDTQDTAVQEILAERSLTDLAAWAKSFPDPDHTADQFGTVLARICRPDDPDVLALLASDDVVVQRLAASYVSSVSRAEGLAWASSTLVKYAGSWSPETVSLFLRALPSSPDVWQLVADQGDATSRAYWQLVRPHALPTSGDEALAAARHLVDAGRPGAALHVFHRIEYRTPKAVPLERIAEALEALTQTTVDSLDGTGPREIATHLDRLDAAGFDTDRLAALEWAYLPLFRFDGRSASVLHRALAEDPAFFVQVLSFAFRGRGEEPSDLSEVEHFRARNAHALLESWRTIPGTQPDGSIDAGALNTWIQDARSRLVEANRTEIGEQYIGGVLRYGPSPQPAPDAETATAPDDPDTERPVPPLVDWPAVVIRDAIEAAASDALETGFELEVRNSRGITSRGLTDGGGQERDLADRYRQQAAFVRITHPRTSAMLTRIAESYDRDAEHHDLDAELTEDTWR